MWKKWVLGVCFCLALASSAQAFILGDDTTGGSTLSVNMNSMFGTQYYCSYTGEINQINIFFDYSTSLFGTTHAMIYSCGGIDQPGVLLAQGERWAVSGGWQNYSLDTPLKVYSGNIYWIFFYNPSTTSVFLRGEYETNPNRSLRLSSVFSIPDPFPTSGYTGNNVYLKMYAEGFEYTPTPTITETITSTETSTCTPTFTRTATRTRTPTATPTPTRTPTATASASFTRTRTITVTSTISPTLTRSCTPTVSATLTMTPTALRSSPTMTPSASPQTWNLNGHKVVAYPNPGKGKIRFATELDQAGPLAISLFNANGEQVAQLHGDGMQGVNVLTWECGASAPGIYLVRVCVQGREVARTKVAVLGDSW